MDPGLVRRFRRGDAEAFSRVYHANVAAVERVVRGSLVRLGLSTSDQPDVVQEVFLRAFSEKVRVSYDANRSYRPFLLAIARNYVVDWGRRVGRVTRSLGASEPHEDVGSETVGAADPFCPRLVAIAAAYVEALPATLRAVYDLRFASEVSQRRAADMLGVSRQKLRTLENRLVNGLRNELRAVEIDST
jgi:RNA polymerase sigma factor (sigma-70 family)